MKKTCIEKYGVNNPFKSDVVRNKTKQFYLRNYGVEFNSQVPEIVEKAQKVLLHLFTFQTPII